MLINDVWVTTAMIPQLCELTGKHRTTVAAWLHRGELPRAVLELLRILQNGDLGRIAPAWRGWILDPENGELCPPNGGRGFDPGHLHAYTWRLHQLAVLEAERRARAGAAESPCRARGASARASADRPA